MKNFLVLVGLFFGLLIISGQSVYAQCPTLVNVTAQSHTDISCFGANDGTITVDLADASTTIPYNFDLFDVNTGLPLIPGFDLAKEAALTAGALGCSISGSGPSFFAWCDGKESAENVRQLVVEAFGKETIQSDSWVGKISPHGAKVIEVKEKAFVA